MKSSQEKIRNASKKIVVILKLGFIVSIIGVTFALIAIGILMFSREDVKSSFLEAFKVMANNGTAISIAPQSLFIMFVFMLIDTLLLSVMIFMIYAIFNDIKKGDTPFLRQNITRIKSIAVIAIILNIVESYSDALVDYYTIGELTWRVDLIGLVIGIVIYYISLIFRYGCDLQQESDETL